jgi:hypothetical protein
VDLFRCESLVIKTHGAMAVIDQFTRRIIGFAAATHKLWHVALRCALLQNVVPLAFAVKVSTSGEYLCPDIAARQSRYCNLLQSHDKS